MSTKFFESLMVGQGDLTKTINQSAVRQKKQESVDCPKIRKNRIKVESCRILEQAGDPDVLDNEFGKDPTSEDESEVVLVIDTDLPLEDEVPEDAAEELIGDKIYKCPVCGSNYACGCDEEGNFTESVDVDEDGVPVECPICSSDADQILVGEIVRTEEAVDLGEEPGDMDPVGPDDRVNEEDDLFEESATGRKKVSENLVNGELPADVDSFLQDVAQTEGTLSYNDIGEFKPSPRSLREIRELMARWAEEVQYEDDEATRALHDIAEKVANIVKGKFESTTRTRKRAQRVESLQNYLDSKGVRYVVVSPTKVVLKDEDESYHLWDDLVDKYGEEDDYAGPDHPIWNNIDDARVTLYPGDQEIVSDKAIFESTTARTRKRTRKSESVDVEINDDEVKVTVDDDDDETVGEDSILEVDCDDEDCSLSEYDDLYEFDDAKFESLMNQMLRENYKGNPSFKLKSAVQSGTSLKLEYVITVGSKSRKGKFIAEGYNKKSRVLRMSARDLGGQFTESTARTPSFKFECVIIGKRVVPTKITYDFKKRVNESLYRVTGEVTGSDKKKS